MREGRLFGLLYRHRGARGKTGCEEISQRVPGKMARAGTRKTAVNGSRKIIEEKSKHLVTDPSSAKRHLA